MAGTYTNLLYHIVFSTKNRQEIITPAIEEELYKYMGGIIRGIEGISWRSTECQTMYTS